MVDRGSSRGLSVVGFVLVGRLAPGGVCRLAAAGWKLGLLNLGVDVVHRKQRGICTDGLLVLLNIFGEFEMSIKTLGSPGVDGGLFAWCLDFYSLLRQTHGALPTFKNNGSPLLC